MVHWREYGRRRMKKAYQGLSISERDLKEDRIEIAEAEGDEINVNVPKINFDLLDMNYDLFHHKEVIAKYNLMW